jgi:hypothetical protein
MKKFFAFILLLMSVASANELFGQTSQKSFLLKIDIRKAIPSDPIFEDFMSFSSVPD